MTATKLSRKATRELIESTFYTLARALESTREIDTYVRQCEQAERGHRNWGPDFGHHHPKAMPAKVCAHHFASKYILEHLAGVAKVPQVEHVFSYKLECYQAYALWAIYEEKIRAAVTIEDAIAYLDAVDYSDLVSPEDR